MPRLIDADILREEILDDEDYIFDNDTINHFLDLVDLSPTIDAEPVVHGHWIDQDSDCEDWHIHQYECSKCGMGDQHNPNINVPYCWFCGAKMDEDKKCEI